MERKDSGAEKALVFLLWLRVLRPASSAAVKRGWAWSGLCNFETEKSPGLKPGFGGLK